MDWTDQLKERLDDSDIVQISIDGTIWTIDSRQGAYSFYNDRGREEVFTSFGDVENAIQSWFEHPVIVVL